MTNSAEPPRDRFLCECGATPTMQCRDYIIKMIREFAQSRPYKMDAFPHQSHYEPTELWMELGADALYRIAPAEDGFVTVNDTLVPVLEIFGWKHGQWISHNTMKPMRYDLWEHMKTKSQPYLGAPGYCPSLLDLKTPIGYWS